LHAVAEAQKKGGIAAFVDAEHALDTVYARKLGVNCDDLLVSQPDTGEQALEIADMLVRSGAIDVLVIDSVAALVPRAEIEGEMGDSHMGLQARLMSQALRKLTGTIGKTRTCVIFINQIRMKIGIVFGNPETTTGGNALKFYASVRLDIRRVGAIKERPSKKPSSILPTARAFRRPEIYLILGCRSTSSKKAVRGTLLRASGSARAVKTSSVF
jgi:recombination protein RecA